MFTRSNLVALALVSVLTNAPMSAAGIVSDVEVRLVPAIAPSGSNQLPGDDAYFTSRLNPVLGRYVEPVQTNQNYSLEVWVSDNNGGNTPNTGVIAAYFDVSWANGTNATGLAPPKLFSLFPAGSIDNANNRVTNFGGSDGSFVGQGLEPTFARVGAINMNLFGDGLVLLNGIIGQGEVGVLNRTVGDVLIVRAAVPEPTSLALLVLGTVAFLRRRQLATRS